MPSKREVIDAVQVVYRDQAPENERNCDWWRSMAEPWRSLARELGIA